MIKFRLYLPYEKLHTGLIFLILTLIFSCASLENKKEKFTGAPGEVKLITLDPGHFHAALVQKVQPEQISPLVHVYAPEGPDVLAHIGRIEGFNRRSDHPTSWTWELYTGADFLEKMLQEKAGNVLVTAGNNGKKTEYIKAAVDAGINVLADKPMCIDADGFELLKQAFRSAEKNGVLLYDIMTERSEITTILQKELIAMPELFGDLLPGSPENPSVVKASVHHFYKYVAGSPLNRPAWFFDVTQEGEGIVDVTTHLVDLIQWECFPEQIIEYTEEILLTGARRWPTVLTQDQFEKVTGMTEFPEYLENSVADSVLNVYCNGEINYAIKGINARARVEWKYRAPEGGGDTHYSIIKGTGAHVIIKQGPEEQYKPELYVAFSERQNDGNSDKIVQAALDQLNIRYPGLTCRKRNAAWQIVIPDEYRIGHEAHFGQVTERFLQYLQDGELPAWEVPNMITKYYITTKALEMARQ